MSFKLLPIKSPIFVLKSSAFLDSSAALSSITLSTMDLANVTPQAFTTWRSQGAKILKSDQKLCYEHFLQFHLGI